MTMATTDQGRACPTIDSGRCDECDGPTRTVRRADGMLIELDSQPHPAGTVVAVRSTDGAAVAQVLTRSALTRYRGQRWMQHRAICRADVERRRPARPGSPLLLSGFPCPGCGGLLPVALLEIGELTHPTCDAPTGSASITIPPHRRTA